jgi:hypothetical protein
MQNVAIFGVPRSGTSWLGQIFNSSPNVIYRYQPIFAYSFEDTLSANSSSKDIRGFHKGLLATDDDFVCQKKNISGNDVPQFSKGKATHLVWKEVRYLNIIEDLIQQSSIKIIGIFRHPCGILKSWMQAPKEFDSDWDIEEEWRYAQKKNSSDDEFYGYERWVQASQMFIKLRESYPEQFFTVSYEALLSDLNGQVTSLFDFTNIPITKHTLSFLQKSTTESSNDPYGVYRKGKTGDEWKKELPSDIIDRIINDDRYLRIMEFLNRN